MTIRSLAGVLAALALAAPAARAAVDGPVTRLAEPGGRAGVIARADGTAVAVWESGADVHVCRIAAGAGVCAAGTDRTLTPAAGAGTTTSRPFVFDLSGGRLLVVRGECCPQHTYRWISADGGATFGAAVDFASVVPSDAGAAVGPGDAVSLLGDPPRYQQGATTGAGKTSASVSLSAAAAPGAHSVAIDPATSRPYAAWASGADTLAAGATSSAGSAFGSPFTLAGATGVRLSGAAATWVRDGRHELGRWTGSALADGTPVPYTGADGGEADVATDAGGGVHLVWTPGGGAVCYSHAASAGATPSTPVLLGRDSDGVANLVASATGVGAGRVVFTAGATTSVLPLATATLTPNVCGLPPASLALAKAAPRSAVTVALDPSGQDTTYHVEHGPTTEYGTSTPDVAVAAGGGPVAAAVDLGPLAPGAEQHARLVAVNASGTTTSADVAFTTPPLSAPARADRVIRFPRRCAGRRLRVALVAKAGAEPVRAVLRVRGRKAVRVGRRLLGDGAVTLTALPRRRVSVSVAVRLADGRVLRRARKFATCA